MPGFDRRWGGGGSFLEVPRSKSAPLNRTSLGHQDAPSPLPNRCASDAAEPECRGRPRPVFALPFLPEGTLGFYSGRSLSRHTFPPPSALSSPFSSVSDPSGSHLQGPWLQSLRTPRVTSPACYLSSMPPALAAVLRSSTLLSNGHPASMRGPHLLGPAFQSQT